jgi:hypothetical protein
MMDNWSVRVQIEIENVSINRSIQVTAVT